MKRIITYLVIAAIFFISSVSSTAIESRYKNNLLNVELSQTPDNRVSVLLVFEKPYTEPIKVIYKTDNEYNILLPETYHSITSVSAINALDVRSANVKLVPYFNQDDSNGYTKITIKTTRPVIFNAHSSYITTKIAKDDLIDKLERDEALKLEPTTLKPQPVKKAAAKQTSKSVPAKKTTATKKAPTVKKSPTTKKAATRKTTAKPVQKAATKPIQKTTQKPVTKTASKPISKPSQTVPNTNTQPVTTQQSQQKTEKQLTQISENTQKEQSQQLTTVTPTQNTAQENTLNNTSAEKQNSQKYSSRLAQKAIEIISAIRTNENTPIAVLITASLLLLGLLIKVFGNTAKAYKSKKVQSHIPLEEPQTAIPQEIKDLSWQEKYKYMKEQEEAQKAAENARQEAQLKEQIENIYTQPAAPTYSDTIQPIRAKRSNSTIEQPAGVSTVEPTKQTQPPQKANTETQAPELAEPFKLSAEPVNEGFELAYNSSSQDFTELEELTTDFDNINDISDIEPVVDEIFEKAPDKEHLEEQINANIEINEPYITRPIEPTLINQAKISKTKGFYLIRYENEVALVGYIKEQIFFIHSFDNMNQSYVHTRLTEKQKGSDIYLVRSDNYKALISVSKNEMKTLINL